MMRNILTALALVLACCPVVQADGGDKGKGKDKTLYALVPAPEPVWQQTGMSLETDAEYLYRVRNNRTIVRQELLVFARRLLDGEGVYGGTAGLVGAAVAVAATDTRVNLNNNGTMGVLLSDTVSADRTVMLQFRKKL